MTEFLFYKVDQYRQTGSHTFNQLATFTLRTNSGPYLNKGKQNLFYKNRGKDSKQNENISAGMLVLIR